MTNTFAKTDIAADWTMIVDGATYARFGVQLVSMSPVDLAIATALPTAVSTDYIVLAETGASREFSEELATGDKVYVRAGRKSDLASLRGFRVSR